MKKIDLGMDREGLHRQVFERRENKCASSCDELAMNESTQHLIPYEKGLITVSKDKRKSRPFCKLARRKEEKSNLSAFEKDKDEEISQVSSSISLSVTLPKIIGDCSIMDSTSSQWFFKSVDNFPQPKVHGQRRDKNRDLQDQVQIRKLSRKLDILKEENEQYARLTGKIPVYNEELLALKTSNFELNREVANLKSQLENQSDDVGIEMAPLPPSVVLQVPDDYEYLKRSFNESSESLNIARHENMQLKEEMVRMNLSIESKDIKLQKLEKEKDASNLCNLDLTLDREKLSQKVTELQTMIENFQIKNTSLEHQITVLKSQEDNLIKSRDWYHQQMKCAQDARNQLQTELISVQSDIASKSMQVEKLKIESLHIRKVLEEEREKSLQEKEDLKRQLEELEVSLINSDVAHSLVLSEDSGHDDDIEEDEDLKMQIEILKDDIKEKANAIEELEHKIEDAKADSANLRSANDIMKMRTAQMQDQILSLEGSKVILMENSEAKDVLIEDLKEVHANSDLAVNRLKMEMREMKISLEQERENCQIMRNDFKKCRDNLTRKENEIERLEMNLKLCKAEESNVKLELAKLNEVREENIALKKKSLLDDHECEALKSAFAAADEARQELEKAHAKLVIDNESLNDRLNSQPNTEALESDLSRKEAELKETVRDREILQCKYDDLLSEMESLKKAFQDLNKDQDQEDLQLKMSRLENSLKIYESANRDLTSKVIDLEENIIFLEHKNGKLISESSQNSELKHKFQKLQDDIVKDTNLRKELLSSIELTKTSLVTEARALESKLQMEKECHAETKNRMIILEHECSSLRVDRRSLRTGLEAANLTIEKLQKQLETMPGEEALLDPVQNPSQPEQKVLKEQILHFKNLFEDSKRMIVGLEDQVVESKLQLKQKSSEVEALQKVMQHKDETNASEINDLRDSTIKLASKLSSLSEEKNGYRAQVQDMTIALKNSLEHIKRLRTQPLQTEDLPELNEKKVQSTDFQRNNLANLQNCLASLKYEMAVLHKKLAPSVNSSPTKQAKGLTTDS